MSEGLREAGYEKAEHLDSSQKARIARMYRSNPGKWSVRNLAKHLGYTRHQVGDVVKTLSKTHKSDDQIKDKQSKYAKWKGKKLPQHIVNANHEGRNKEIETRPDSSMEGPVRRALTALGISFKTQIDLNTFFKLDNPEAGIVDFFIPSKKTFLEADGPRHTLKNVKARSANKDSLIRSKGYKIVRITPSDMSNLKQVLQERL